MKHNFYLFLKFFKLTMFLFLICLSNHLFQNANALNLSSKKEKLLSINEDLKLRNQSQSKNNTILKKFGSKVNSNHSKKKIDKIFNLFKYLDITYKFYQVHFLLFRTKNLKIFLLIRILP